MTNSDFHDTKKNRFGCRNRTLLTDFYEITMANGYLENGLADQIAYFDMFFRKVPDNGGFAIAAGLAQLVEYLENLKFDEEDLAYLQDRGIFSEKFLDYLKNFEFICDVWAVPEGTPIFPNEPIIKVRGPVVQAQFIETMLLLIMNHQSLIATKTNRIVRAASGRAIVEFGARRAQGGDAALYGARAAFIGGAAGTSNTLAAAKFDIPPAGTMAHSWVQLFPSELEAFQAYARTYLENCVLLIDTYNVLKSGLPNAIKVAQEELNPRGFRLKAVRIDSGDFSYLARMVRKELDQAGLEDCKIMVSSSLDEDIIRELLLLGSPIDSFGVGERLITAQSDPVFGGVYKLSAVEEDGQIVPKMKISNNVGKITDPGAKKIFRLYDNATGKGIADIITLEEETIDDSKPFEIFNPLFPWKKRTVDNFRAEEMMVKIFERGKLIYHLPTVQEIQSYCARMVDTLWPEILRFENPHEYYVNLSRDLWKLKNDLIYKHSQE
ncbi:nicotinate phosphoribosyltransferase [Dehalobacterium formicoaceticum]|uniref:Nicotinate phosphoribosyltransferase n=1 Tax=Dehalobacterium formicoaceticum TaxID=51515 RepID=A0ABT1XZV2_9FIRM|nr:nicotinate phosphoribosyltransferase [Dehalobacterium formicoaceticum]MCR6544147.1 nicotinate phosphoribosyltransferase [Dehalobacterium formicoaceticum]